MSKMSDAELVEAHQLAGGELVDSQLVHRLLAHIEAEGHERLRLQDHIDELKEQVDMARHAGEAEGLERALELVQDNDCDVLATLQMWVDDPNLGTSPARFHETAPEQRGKRS